MIDISKIKQIQSMFGEDELTNPNEQKTKRLLIEPFFEALGYNGLELDDEVASVSKGNSGKGRIDFFVKVKSGTGKDAIKEYFASHYRGSHRSV